MHGHAIRHAVHRTIRRRYGALLFTAVQPRPAPAFWYAEFALTRLGQVAQMLALPFSTARIAESRWEMSKTSSRPPGMGYYP
jgi:hypothetical protein